MKKKSVTTSDATAAGLSRSIELDDFPFEFLSSLAQRESWRKEIYRPIYHIHKWWAKRLGSIFRGIILGCLLRPDEDFRTAFYEAHDFSGITVFDPFMGSGTTVGEAHKLGCIALGRDINPVACEGARVAFGPLHGKRLSVAFHALSASVGKRIRELYRSPDDRGRLQDVLYYFWVKQATCPDCHSPVDLFPTRIFARDADPARKPAVQVCCPQCGDVFAARRRDELAECPTCRLSFDPGQGTAAGTKAKCSKCAREFPIAQTIRAAERVPSHRLYAKLLLYADGTKRYLAGADDDHDSYLRCSQLLAEELARGAIRLPTAVLNDGYNTRQAIGYNYRCWKDFFNDRQLLALSWLQEAISQLPDPEIRDAMLTLFSGLLEFNNLFASYKGEGTGAVRHMFSHHILKPERLPIEANVWGTPKSSGSFRNLFAGRLLRAVEYRAAPFEVRDHGDGKVYTGETFSGRVESNWPAHWPVAQKAIYLSCGSSDATGLPDHSVDLIITDPPFFDNVHYSELADFFHAWQSLFPRGFITDQTTTRDPREVQDTEADRFAYKLGRVFTECKRLLKDDGLLVFTYHHSREDGWTSLVRAMYGAGFSIVQAHPVKAELSVATPKSQAKEPIQLDIIFVCRERTQDCRASIAPSTTLTEAARCAREKLLRLRSLGLCLSLNDCRVTVISQFLKLLGAASSPEAAVEAIATCRVELDQTAKAVYREAHDMLVANGASHDKQQLSLFSAAD